MRKNLFLRFVYTDLLFGMFFFGNCQTPDSWLLPINCKNRKDIHCFQLTEIGQFGLRRKERPNIPSHLHTGIDIKRPNDNYFNEPVFAASKGFVISVRSDGPFAQIIIEHSLNKTAKVWTIYEHVSGIIAKVGDVVATSNPIARFMNKEELNRYGWKFNHLHFEVMKKAPMKMKPEKSNPQRLFSTYGLVCYNEKLLMENYFDPVEFFSR
jgi:murein DD-endopeptidase MepM/ murein hydrolase activator NlpD